MLPVEWIAGFSEGEATWTIHQHWNHTTKAGEPVYYKIPMLTFQVSQKERQPLDLIEVFFTFYGVKGKVYIRNNNHGGAFEYRTVGCANVHKVSRLLAPHMHSERKIKQMFSNLLSCSGTKCSPNHLGRSEVFELVGIKDPIEVT